MSKNHDLQNLIAYQDRQIKTLNRSNLKQADEIEQLKHSNSILKRQLQDAQDKLDEYERSEQSLLAENDRLKAMMNEPFTPFWFAKQMAKDNQVINNLGKLNENLLD